MRLPTLPMADWTASAPTRRSALASCVTVASGYDSTAGYFTSLFNGGLLNREKTAFRRDTLRLGASWSKHVRCPKALPLSMVLRLQQTTAKEAREIPGCGVIAGGHSDAGS